MGAEHPVVAISLQTLGHVLRLRQQLDEALDVAKRCEALRSASSSQAQGPQMAAALYLQVCLLSRHIFHQTGEATSICCTDSDQFAGPRCFILRGHVRLHVGQQRQSPLCNGADCARMVACLRVVVRRR
jgi:hypothetical protein